MRLRLPLLVLPIALLLSAACSSAGPEAASPGPRRVDHHVHLLGDDILRDWRAAGATFSRPDEAYKTAQRVLGAPGEPPGGTFVSHAVLVSMAHLYGSEELFGLKLSVEEERVRVARENDHVAREAARYPGRAAAFCSAPVLRGHAREELERCHRVLRCAGIKIHVASSGVDLRKAADLDELAKIAAWAEKEGLLVLLHLDPQRRGTTVADVERFAETVLRPHPRLTVIVAHLGGSGGYGRWTRSVFRTLTGWMQRAGESRANLLFDISAVLLEEASEGVPAITPEDAATLGADLRAAGLDLVVFGSDSPVFDSQRTAEALTRLAGLSVPEVDAILARSPRGLLTRPR